MSKRSKVTFEEKIHAVEDYLAGKRNQKQIAQDLGLGKRGRSTVGLWVRRYREIGPDALQNPLHSKKYTRDFKEQVVREYREGKGSMEELCMRYGIPNHDTVHSWISVYDSHGELKATPVASEVYMAKGRKVSKEERLEAIQFCLAHDLDYSLTASRYELAYWQIYSWVKRYQSEGKQGMSDGRDRKRSKAEIDETEQLKRRIRVLEQELNDERMKNELLKKVQEVERRRYSPKGN